MRIRVWGNTDIGLKRERNEDSYLVDEDLGLFLVADGMGGHRGGEVASSMAVSTVHEHVAKRMKDARRVSPRQLLAEAYLEASRNIYERSQEAGKQLHGMGTTLVSAYINNNTIYIANVGDSRAYLLSKQHLWQLTEDHSLMNEQIRAGLITDATIKELIPKNVITRSVGFERDVVCDILEREIQVGDVYLLCSDGLSGLVDDQKIEEILMSKPTHLIVPIFIEQAKKNGGDDNITVMVIYAESQTG